MKTLLNTFIAVVLFFLVADTVQAGKVKTFSSAEISVENDKTVDRTIRGLKQDGFTEVSRNSQNINYFTACTSNCHWATYTVVMNSPTVGDYSLTQTYAYVNIVVYFDVATDSYYVNNVFVEEMLVY